MIGIGLRGILERVNPFTSEIMEKFLLKKFKMPQLATYYRTTSPSYCSMDEKMQLLLLKYNNWDLLCGNTAVAMELVKH